MTNSIKVYTPSEYYEIQLKKATKHFLKNNQQKELLKEFMTNLKSIYFFGSLIREDKKYKTKEIKTKFEKNDIDINIELEEDYFKKNILLLEALEKELNIYFSDKLKKEVDIHFSIDLDKINKTIFLNTNYEGYGENIIRQYIRNGIQLYDKPIKIDVKDYHKLHRHKTSIVKKDETNYIIEQLNEIAALTLIKESRLSKLYKYSTSSIDSRLRILDDSFIRFEWLENSIETNDYENKQMQKEILLNTIRFFIIDGNLFLSKLYNYEKKKNQNNEHNKTNNIQDIDPHLLEYYKTVFNKDDEMIFDQKQISEDNILLNKILNYHKTSNQEYELIYNTKKVLLYRIIPEFNSKTKLIIKNEKEREEFSSFYNFINPHIRNYLKLSHDYATLYGIKVKQEDYSNFILNDNHKINFFNQEKAVLRFISSLCHNMQIWHSFERFQFFEFGLNQELIKQLNNN